MVRDCGKKGLGSMSGQTFDAHDLVIEYVGEVVRKKVGKQLIVENKSQHLMWLSEHSYLHAVNHDNVARCINHSCEPNCMVETWHVDGLARAGFFLTKEIVVNKEITLDHNCSMHDHKDILIFDCYCKIKTCRRAPCAGIICLNDLFCKIISHLELLCVDNFKTGLAVNLKDKPAHDGKVIEIRIQAGKDEGEDIPSLIAVFNSKKYGRVSSPYQHFENSCSSKSN